MAPANVELVRLIFAAWERGEFGSGDWADRNTEFARVDGPAPGNWEGHVDIARAMREAMGAWSEFRVEAEEYRELDQERVLVFVDLGLVPESSAPDSQRG